MKAVYLTEEDAVIVRQLIHDFKRQIKTPPEDLTNPHDDIFTPEVYVAEIPLSGIPPLTKVSGKYIPGSATCNIYKIWPKSGGGFELIVTYFDELVYNVSPITISGTDTAKFKIVWRDKFGDWVTEREGYDQTGTGTTGTGSTGTGSTGTGSTGTGSTGTGSTGTGSTGTGTGSTGTGTGTGPTGTGTTPTGTGTGTGSETGTGTGTETGTGSGTAPTGTGSDTGTGSGPTGTGSDIGTGTGSSTGTGSKTIIVPVPWSQTGYTALFVAEMPEVRFDDIIHATVMDKDSYVPIDPRLVDVCEPDSLAVCGCVPDVPVLVGAIVECGGIRVRLGGRKRKTPVTLTIRLTGIRKGFAGTRFPSRTREQFIANERFLQSAYPGAGRET